MQTRDNFVLFDLSEEGHSYHVLAKTVPIK